MDQTQNIRFNGDNFVANDKFLRRIPWWHLKRSGEISSAAFQNDGGTNSFSTNWMKLSSIEDTLRNHPGFGLASISAKLCWDLNQKIKWEPLEDNVAHCEIVGRKTDSISKKLRDGAEPLVYPQRLDEWNNKAT